MFRRLTMPVLIVAMLSLAGADAILAQTDVARQRYGDGVHAYFAGEYHEAHDHLSTAIRLKSTDPRCFYFRGLTYLKLGRERQAIKDFERGAALEMGDSLGRYNVDSALTRVQGRNRLLLEEFRQEARVAAYEREQERIEKRYGDLRARDLKMLEDRAEAAIIDRDVDGPPIVRGAFGAYPIDPFMSVEKAPQEEPETAQTEPREEAAAPETTVEEAEDSEGVLSVFGEGFGEALKGLGGDAATESEGGMGSPFNQPPSADDENPFQQGADANPFGAGAVDDAAVEDATTGDDAQANPFGGAEQDATETTDEPAADSNPFGEPAANESTNEAPATEQQDTDAETDDANSVPATSDSPATSDDAADQAAENPFESSTAGDASSDGNPFGETTDQTEEPAEQPADENPFD